MGPDFDDYLAGFFERYLAHRGCRPPGSLGGCPDFVRTATPDCPRTVEFQWQGGQQVSRTEERTGTLRHRFVEMEVCRRPDHSAPYLDPRQGRAN